MNALSAAPVLHVSSLEAALAFYTGVLQFEEAFRFGRYAGFCKDQVTLHVAEPDDGQRPVGGGSVYITCDAVDEYFEQVSARGGRPLAAPSDAPYGMRDFAIRDPDGNQLRFGCEIDGA